jgi:hypothetical protein
MSYTDSPYENIPHELLSKYNMNGTVPILPHFINGKNDLDQQQWSKSYMDNHVNNFTSDKIKKGQQGEEPYIYGSFWILKAVEKYGIKNKRVAVIGSLVPWIEAILLNFGNTVTTVEYNVPIVDYPNLSAISYWDFQKTENKYDCIVTYSSVEHSGLGRYGDPLDPDGDLKTMADIHKNLTTNGILVWGAPVGHDAVVWNAHRIYGRIRLPVLFNGFCELEWIDVNKEMILNQQLASNSINPVIVLLKI